MTPSITYRPSVSATIGPGAMRPQGAIHGGQDDPGVRDGGPRHGGHPPMDRQRRGHQQLDVVQRVGGAQREAPVEGARQPVGAGADPVGAGRQRGQPEAALVVGVCADRGGVAAADRPCARTPARPRPAAASPPGQRDPRCAPPAARRSPWSGRPSAHATRPRCRSHRPRPAAGACPRAASAGIDPLRPSGPRTPAFHGCHRPGARSWLPGGAHRG